MLLLSRLISPPPPPRTVIGPLVSSKNLPIAHERLTLSDPSGFRSLPMRGPDREACHRRPYLGQRIRRVVKTIGDVGVHAAEREVGVLLQCTLSADILPLRQVEAHVPEICPSLIEIK